MSLLSEKTPKEPQTVMKGRSKVEIHGSTPETFTDLAVIAKRDSKKTGNIKPLKGGWVFFFFIYGTEMNLISFWSSVCGFSVGWTVSSDKKVYLNDQEYPQLPSSRSPWVSFLFTKQEGVQSWRTCAENQWLYSLSCLVKCIFMSICVKDKCKSSQKSEEESQNHFYNLTFLYTLKTQLQAKLFVQKIYI